MSTRDADESEEVLSSPCVVGVISRTETLTRIPRLHEVCDWVEIRADLIGPAADAWLKARINHSPCPPPLFTVRSAREGGKWGGSEAERIERYTEILPYVCAVDIELESEAFPEILKRAKKARRFTIASFHDFHLTPDEDRLRTLIDRAEQAGADVVKLATWTATEADVQRLENQLSAPPKNTLVSVMGMGPLGAESRLRLARAGSLLVYGFLDAESAPGQLSSAELVRRLVELQPGYERLRSRRSTQCLSGVWPIPRLSDSSFVV